MKTFPMHNHKKLLQLFILLFGVLSYAQSYKQDILRGEFTYQLRAKFDKRVDNKHEAIFITNRG